MIAYAKRENLFEKAERRWTVEPVGLRRQVPGERDMVMRWTDVVEVRLTYAPTRMKTWRHKLTLRTRRSTWVIDNAHFAGVGAFEDRSAAFSALVLACVERVREAAPEATARLGAAPAAYWAQMGFVGAAFWLLGWVIVALPTTWSAMVWVKLGLIVAMLPVLFAFAARAWPRRTTLDPDGFRAALPGG